LGNHQLIVREVSADDFFVCNGVDLQRVTIMVFLVFCIFIGYFYYIYAIRKIIFIFFKKHQLVCSKTIRSFVQNINWFALKL